MIKRKCALCGGDIEVSLPYSRQYVYYKTKAKWYHIDCFTVVTTPRIKCSDWLDKTQEFVTTEVSKDNISRMIQNHYKVTLVPKYIYIKLDSIYKGVYKGLAVPIPPEDLYEMFQRKMPYLDKMATKKKLSGVSRFNYDLAIIINKYDSFLKWRTEEESQVENTFSKEDKVTFQKQPVHSNNGKPNDIDIGSVIDEIMD